METFEAELQVTYTVKVIVTAADITTGLRALNSSAHLMYADDLGTPIEQKVLTIQAVSDEDDFDDDVPVITVRRAIVRRNLTLNDHPALKQWAPDAARLPLETATLVAGQAVYIDDDVPVIPYCVVSLQQPVFGYTVWTVKREDLEFLDD